LDCVSVTIFCSWGRISQSALWHWTPDFFPGTRYQNRKKCTKWTQNVLNDAGPQPVTCVGKHWPSLHRGVAKWSSRPRGFESRRGWCGFLGHCNAVIWNLINSWIELLINYC
jgi:hypothetical protein